MCQLEAAKLAQAQRWLSTYEKFWTARLDDLEAILREEDSAAAKSATKKAGE